MCQDKHPFHGRFWRRALNNDLINDTQALLGARLLGVRGRWEHVDGVRHLIAHDLHDFSHLLGELQTSSRDFH